MSRRVEVTRNTSETQIHVVLDLDGTGKQTLNAGVPFLDHILDRIARHSMVDLDISITGDTHIDDHHTVEDVDITLGQAVTKAIDDKKGIVRYGHSYMPLDEALSRVVIDSSGRPGLEFHIPFTHVCVGNFGVDLSIESFRKFVSHAGVTLHIDNLRGVNAHHQIGTVFKAFDRALRMTVKIDPRATGMIPSTEGALWITVSAWPRLSDSKPAADPMDLTRSFFSPLTLINPIGAIPFLISLTESQTGEKKRRTIKVVSISMAIVIGLSALLDEQIISSFGFSVDSLQISGRIIMIIIALSMLNAQTSRTKATPEEEDEAGARASIAIMSLAIPLLTGPDSINTIIVYVGRTKHWWDLFLLAGVGVAIAAVVRVVLRAAKPIACVTGCTGINVGTRLMGLILAALAVEFIVDGLRTLLPVLRA